MPEAESLPFDPDRMWAKKSFRDRFWEGVSSHDECREWGKARQVGGYGTVAYRRRRLLAHRVAWMLTYGPIPDGLCVLHRCDNPPCVNPEHLFLGTRIENNADMVAKGRLYRGPKAETPARWASRKRGEQQSQAKLTAEQVREMRHKYAGGDLSFRELGRRYGVGHATVANIIRGKKWRAVENVA